MSDSAPTTGKSDAKAWAKPALKIALIYVILGLIWIQFSDKLVGVVTGDPEMITRLQTLKGWLYVSFTGLLLYSLVKSSLKARQQIEETLRQRNRELDLANQLGQELSSAFELAAIITKVLQEICRVLRITACSIWLVDAATSELVCHEVANPEDGLVRGWRLSPEQGVAGWATAQGQSVIVADTLTDERRFDGVDQQTGVTIRSIMAVPLIVRKCAIGVIEVVHTETDYFQPTDLVLVELLAASAASVIENATLYSQLQAHTADLETRVAIRTQELEEANLELQELDRLKSKFVSDVSHELRTPVTNLMMYLDLLDRGNPEKLEKYLAVLKDQAGRLAQLIENILDLSRLDVARDKPVELETVNLNDVVEQTVATLMPSAQMKGLEITYKLAHDLPPVRGVRSQLAQVTTNLLANAINYTEAGYVHVSTRFDADADQICLEVEDSGIGIPSKDLKHIFSRFYRGHNVSQLDLPGSGLGLAIAREIVEQHQGEINVKSVVGAGSTFQVWLPVDD